MREHPPLFVVEALSGDEALLAAPLASLVAGARIHSVFERVVNVALAGGGLITLASSASDNAPDTLVSNVRAWTMFDLAPGQAIRFVDGRLLVGESLAVSLASARPWQCRLPSYARNTGQFSANLALAWEALKRQGQGIGVEAGIGVAQKDENPVDRALRQKFVQAGEGLCQSLADRDWPQAQAHALRLIGLGPGLTPAGDDFLLGLLAVLNIPGSPGYDLRRIGDDIVAHAQRQTHAISLAGLRHAAGGRVRESLAAFCRALMHGDAQSVRAALAKVLQIGASSGTDIACGMLSGFEIHLQKQKTA